MIDKMLLDILACPDTKEDVYLAPAKLVDAVNAKIAAGTLRNRADQQVTEKIDSGLLRKDRKFLYPIREDIPIMLIDEAIPVGGWPEAALPFAEHPGAPVQAKT